MLKIATSSSICHHLQMVQLLYTNVWLSANTREEIYSLMQLVRAQEISYLAQQTES